MGDIHSCHIREFSDIQRYRSCKIIVGEIYFCNMSCTGSDTISCSYIASCKPIFGMGSILSISVVVDIYDADTFFE